MITKIYPLSLDLRPILNFKINLQQFTIFIAKNVAFSASNSTTDARWETTKPQSRTSSLRSLLRRLDETSDSQKFRYKTDIDWFEVRYFWTSNQIFPGLLVSQLLVKRN